MREIRRTEPTRVVQDDYDSLAERVWHAAYCRWYDHMQAGHRRRAAAWGYAADALCRVAWG